jgi:hypothetical protein
MKVEEYNELLETVFRSASTYEQKLSLAKALAECYVADSFPATDLHEAQKLGRLIQDDIAAYKAALGIDK